MLDCPVPRTGRWAAADLELPRPLGFHSLGRLSGAGLKFASQCRSTRARRGSRGRGRRSVNADIEIIILRAARDSIAAQHRELRLRRGSRRATSALRLILICLTGCVLLHHDRAYNMRKNMYKEAKIKTFIFPRDKVLILSRFRHCSKVRSICFFMCKARQVAALPSPTATPVAHPWPVCAL